MSGRPKATEHGTYGFARANKCPCADCRRAVSRYQKGYNVDRARGTRRRVSAVPARRKVQALLDAGARPHQIYTAAGFVDAVFTHLMEGTEGRPPAELIQRNTAQKIRDLTLEDVLAVPTLVPNPGVVRRLQALQYMGHGPHQIAPVVGVSVAQLYQYTWADQCLTRTVEAIHAAYVELRDTKGPSAFARWRAYREGWAPPMSWDDESIDDPDTAPHLPACIVEACGREVFKANLCKNHHEMVAKVGGFKESRRYRPAVMKVSQRTQVRKADGRDSVLDLLELGVTDVGEIAERARVSRDYALRIVKEMAA